ncbi:glycosyltransferase family 4 protein [Lactobacillus helveticus]|uniref:glycosyltransferase family 4 protein n=1 Tax=Lactobacillus helveticus TaxID=1587 RepID=UPI00156231F2|nr:glycosyltransferase family 4 protein [Lactobacillus helveticus]NRO86962.1 Mannosylfructose-phosphate synthase [Lactobacillus helveticus]
MKIIIFTADSNGGFPVPAVKGGAVSTLIESLVNENNKKKLCDMTVVSLYNKKAKDTAKKKYPNVHFKYIKVPLIIRVLDKSAFFIMKKCFKKEKSISYKSVFSLLFYILKSSSFLKRAKTDKVILENNIPLALIIKLSNYRGQYYYHLHNVPRINAGCRNVFKNCTAYLCVSKYVCNQIESIKNPIGPVSPKKVRILHNAINTNRFKVLANRNKLKYQIAKRYNFNVNDKIILYTGRISLEKGIDKAIDALKYLKDSQFVFLIVGSISYGDKSFKNDYVEKVKKRAKKLGKKVRFTGYIAQNELPIIYNVADLAILPSMWDEPAGLTMIEAMACGVPVITTRSGGIPEYVGNDAIVIERDKMLIKNLAFSINKVLEDPEVYRRKGISRIKNNFSEDNYLERFMKCIEK